MIRLYKEIQNAQNAFKNGAISYYLINESDYKLVFVLEEWVTLVIQLNDATITYDELFSYMIGTDEIYQLVSTRLECINSNLSCLMLDLI